ncbi:MAG: DNRLRE domain-containing protein [Gemmatimonadetes bacterium]|nr:DNRLRE domain-containing protein [Gemmatimonadota bacterium]
MRTIVLGASLTLLAAAAGPLAAQALPAATSKPILVTSLLANADSRVQGTVSTNFGDGDLIVGLPDKVVFMHFDLKSLPAGAVVRSAELVLSYRQLSEGTNEVQLGRVGGSWRETTVNAVNQPPVRWSSNHSRTVTPGATIKFDVKPVLDAWLAGEPNYGFALRGDGPLMYGYSRETGPSEATKPHLRIQYIVP